MPAVDEILLPLHTGATLAMFGVIWFVQIVHYPLMASVGPAAFDAWHARNLRRTTWVVGPLMLLEVACASALLRWPPRGVPQWMPWAGIALMLAIWLSTAALQVPQHRRLERGWDERAHRALVRSNWVRTAAWSARGVLALAIAARAAA